MNADKTDYDLLYNPRLVVKDYQAIFDRWEKDSERARARLDCYLDVPYGTTEAEKLDIFPAQGKSRALLAYIHGGYWRSLDKKRFSFVAPALVKAGITVAVPNYALCPAVQVEDIVMQMVQACAWLYRNGGNFGAPADRLYLCGHSAGGHLAAMMLCCEWPKYSPDLPKKVACAALSISGLYDLTEIVKVPSVNCDVRLDEKSALRVSPAFLPPATDARSPPRWAERKTRDFTSRTDSSAKDGATRAGKIFPVRGKTISPCSTSSAIRKAACSSRC